MADKINSYLIEPTLHLVVWDYSESETKFPGWLIIKSEINDTGILVFQSASVSGLSVSREAEVKITVSQLYK